MRSPAEWLSLDAYLAKGALTPMWPPGHQFLYTNAAYDLLGLAVQDVTGRPYADYMSERILDPLGMGRSSFQQPPTCNPTLLSRIDTPEASRRSLPRRVASVRSQSLRRPLAGWLPDGWLALVSIPTSPAFDGSLMTASPFSAISCAVHWLKYPLATCA